jgi:hypothetical protein
MIKDADGTARYETAETTHFSDGSMEQDLPMRQLSEMFNVNHFIISQANPHAALFASYYHVRSVWSSPIFGFFNGMLSFLKDRCRSWVVHFVNLVGAHRIAPIHATSRGIASQVLVQEYEGRDCDISLIPWISHRSLFSAIMHVLYNPEFDEIRGWVDAAERETWKYIPAIKSHIAEEITLDRCVQRLRKRLVPRKRRISSKGAQHMGIRGLPSFFTSPSVESLGGLGILDQTNIERKTQYQQQQEIAAATHGIIACSGSPSLNTNLGWGGMGLHGNGSSGSLKRLPSAPSGLFVEDKEHSVTEQVAGDHSIHSYLHNPDSAGLIKKRQE